MSLATVAADPANNVVATRVEKKSVKSTDEYSGGFKSFVRDDSTRDTASPRKADETQGIGGKNRDEANAEIPQGLWQRFGALFERAAAAPEAEAVDPDATAEEDSVEIDESLDELIAQTEAEGAHPVAQPGAETKNRTGAATEQPSTKTPSVAAEADADADSTRVTGAAQVSKQATAGANATDSMAVTAKLTAQGERLPDAQARMPGNATRLGDVEPKDHAGQKAAQAVVPENGAARGDADAAKDDGRERGGQNAGQLAGGGRIAGVSVVSQQAAPAPAFQVQSAPMSDTGSALATSLASEMQSLERTGAATLGGMTRSGAAAPITTLRIQLNPAELGMVTARLSGSEAQMQIEITVDNAEARHRLAADSDSIVSALRGMGIEIDRITVQQSQSGSGTTPNGAGRGSEFSQSGENGGEQHQQKASKQGSERGNGENPQGGRNGANSDASGGGVYI